MLAALLEEGATYREVAARYRVRHSTVERQIKSLLLHVSRQRPIRGLDDLPFVSLGLLRRSAPVVMEAVRGFSPNDQRRSTPAPMFGEEQVAAGVHRLRRLSSNPNRDVALLYILLCTGAKPLEIARMLVRDYLNHDGTVRGESELRQQAAIGGHARPLYFGSARACAAIDSYLEERSRRKVGLGSKGAYRGLDPESALFLTEHCRPFEVRPRSVRDPRPTSPVLIATYRVILHRAGWEGVTAQAVRRIVAHRLTEKGADKQQVGQLLGLASNRSVKRLLQRPPQPLKSLVKDLV